MTDLRQTILLVEDDHQIREMVGLYLDIEGYRVVGAESGPRALELIEEEPVDLVLLDIMMPGMSGTEVLEKLRHRYTALELPVLMMTALGRSEDIVTAFQLGANDYLTKPLDLPILLARLKARLRPKKRDPTLEPGKVFDGKYRIESVVGRGRYATVYHATHVELRREVAVKVFHVDLEAHGADLALVYRIDHPNAVSVYDLSTTSDGSSYLVMELLKGETLEARLRRGSLSLEECGAILFPLCEVLAEAHAQGVVHRDLQPANVYLHDGSRGEVVKVLDFAVAPRLGKSPAIAKSRLGAASVYFGPERFSDDPEDGRVDVYSLGIMVCQMLTGELPFAEVPEEEAPWSEWASWVATSRPRPLRDLAPELSEALEGIVIQTLDKDLHRRPTVADLVLGLAAVLPMPGGSELSIESPEAGHPEGGP